MKRVAVAAAVATLAVPASALAAARGAGYNARVLRSSGLGLVLRRLDGRMVRFSADQIAAMPSGALASGDGRAPIAHMAGGPRSAAGTIQVLDPGVVVRVTQNGPSSGRPTVTLGVPGGIGGGERATGVIGGVAGASFLLDTPGGTELRLHGSVAGLRPCERARVSYHQDQLTLVADRVTPLGPSDCAV